MKIAALVAALVLAVGCGGAGDAGQPGAVGPQGTPGAPGAQGSQGTKGDPGVAGPAGPTGAKGDVGPQGQKGDPGATAGVTGPTGAQGPKGDTGATGQTGATGPQGPAGPQGAPGATNRITASLNCNGGLEGLDYTIVSYNAYVFSDGFVFASAEVFNNGSSSTTAKFYAPQQVGWDTASVRVHYDAFGTPDYGFWDLSVNRDTAVLTVTVHDIDLADPGQTRSWIFTPDKCVLNHY
jgi:hypothetical protein